ncbi:MAG: aryl-sulfate sulfotransferase [Bacilli bacterium]|nr:aryl-sulfate sulfotransferase [Bacilli bacterium]
MKTKYKYLLLIIVTILASIFIYNYIEANKSVKKMEDLFKIQREIDKQILEDTNYTIENPKVILNPYKISPLTALVVFKTNDLAAVTVTVKGKDGDEDIVNTSIPSKEHLLSIYGLYPNFENTVIIKASSSEKVLKIKTNTLPSTIAKASAYESNANDFYFTTSSNINGYPVAYDKNGNVRWYLKRSFGYDFTRLENGYILLGNNALMKEPYYSSGLVEMDLLGKIYYEYNIPGGYYKDVYEKSDGNLILLSNDFSSNSKEDFIVEIDRNTGDIVKSFHLGKLFKQTGNWIYLNSLSFDEKTNSIICVGSKKDQIIDIDYNTGEVNWVISKNIDGNKKYLLSKDGDGEYPILPSSVILLDGDSIAYINSVNDEKHLVIYDINTVDRTFKERENYNLGSSNGEARLEYKNGDFLITMGDTIKKLTDNELTTVMKTRNNLYSTKASGMYAGDMYLRDSGLRLGHTGITKTITDHNVIIHKMDKSVFKTYDLKLAVDSRRLIVRGTFKKNDNVQIILDNVLSKKTYDVDILSGNETISGKMQTATYINKEGVYGKYYIYLRINGVNYKLGKYVIMS